MVGKYQILVKVSSPECKQEKRLMEFYQDLVVSRSDVISQMQKVQDITSFATPNTETVK